MQYKVSHLQTKPVRARIIGVILSLTLLSPVAAQTSTLGVHTFSYHDHGRFNNSNFGVYIEHSGWTGGYYRNSINKDSVYAG